LTEGELGAEFEDAGGEVVGGGEGRGVKGEDRGVLALVVGGVDIDELCGEISIQAGKN